MAKKNAQSRKKAKGLPAADSYGSLSQQPLQILIFLLPLIILYEVAMLIAFNSARAGDIKARSIIRLLFDSIGVTGLVLPGLLLIIVLLVMHAYRKDRWRFLPKMYGMMWIESLVLALPILVFTMLLLHKTAPAASFGGAENLSWISKIVVSVGAGIYEELLFRLIGIALIHFIVVDLIKAQDYVGELAAIGITALLFAAYHFTGNNVFTGRKFAFFTLAGVYLACIYIYRGFGIVAGTHAMYDVLVATLSEFESD
ncbi:MAG: CPBP family intramembrane glutamic endopeptidase [Phycisphaeraceae bacterium]